MRGVTVIILQAFVAQAITKEDPLDKVADSLIAKLVDKLSSRVPLQDEDLDGTTLGKTHADMGFGTRMSMQAAQPLASSAVSIAQERLRARGISPSPLQTLALTAIDASNRGTGMRNVVAMAANLPSQSRAALSQLGKDVVVKAATISKDSMAGATAPFGFWDPMGFAATVNGETLAFYREAELKHGRLGMIASLGFMAGETFSPLLGADSGAMAKLWGKALPAVPEQFWGAIVVAAAFVELSMLNAQEWDESLTEPGDFGWDPLGVKPKDAKGLMEMQNKELNNGRLAMLAAAGMIAQELVTGEKIFR